MQNVLTTASMMPRGMRRTESALKWSEVPVQNNAAKAKPHAPKYLLGPAVRVTQCGRFGASLKLVCTAMRRTPPRPRHRLLQVHVLGHRAWASLNTTGELGPGASGVSLALRMGTTQETSAPINMDQPWRHAGPSAVTLSPLIASYMTSSWSGNTGNGYSFNFDGGPNGYEELRVSDHTWQ